MVNIHRLRLRPQFVRQITYQSFSIRSKACKMSSNNASFNIKRMHSQNKYISSSLTRGQYNDKSKSQVLMHNTIFTGIILAIVSLTNLAICEEPEPINDLLPSILGKPYANRGKYVLYGEIGRGGFSTVRLALDTETNELLAAKIFDPKYSTSDDIAREIDIVREVGEHSNIMYLYDVLYFHDETIMFTELVRGGELFDYIADMGSVSEEDASRLLRDTCLALEFLHSSGICHRDLKPENLLLSDQSVNADIRISDFGLSRRQRKGEWIREEHPSGTIAYWAPEIIKRQPQDFGVDMWALGVLAYIVLTGVHPFDSRGDLSDAEIISRIASGDYDKTNPWYVGLSIDAQDFLNQLLESQPEKRITAAVALDHPWLKGITPTTTPLPEGHGQRLLAYKRLQRLRANILTVMMGAQYNSMGYNTSWKQGDQEKTIVSDTNMEMFKEAFALFDRDNSGDIDREELEGVLVALGQHLPRHEIDAIIKLADISNDGKISFNEFVAMMNGRLFKRGEITEPNLKAAFHVFDSNGDGYICADELRYVMQLLGNQGTISEKEIENLIRVVDTNGDGKFDYSEFVHLMTKTKW